MEAGLNFAEVEAVIGRDPIIGSDQRHLARDGRALQRASLSEPSRGTQVALVIGRAVAADTSPDSARAAIIGAAVALEIVDVSRPPDDLEGIVIENACHRAFVLGPVRPVDPSRSEGRLVINGNFLRRRQQARITVLWCARLQFLGAVGEQLQRRDHVLSGALTHLANSTWRRGPISSIG